jgi:RNA polymerase sigma-70 factor (ECF subfamily)
MPDTSVSLLDGLRLQPSADGWSRLVGFYTPLIRCWLGRQGVGSADVDDLTQDVLAVVVRELPHF